MRMAYEARCRAAHSTTSRGRTGTGAKVHRKVDLGFSDVEIATQALLHRPGGWAERWKAQVSRVRFGIDEE